MSRIEVATCLGERQRLLGEAGTLGHVLGIPDGQVPRDERVSYRGLIACNLRLNDAFSAQALALLDRRGVVEGNGKPGAQPRTELARGVTEKGEGLSQQRNEKRAEDTRFDCKKSRGEAQGHLREALAPTVHFGESRGLLKRIACGGSTGGRSPRGARLEPRRKFEFFQIRHLLCRNRRPLEMPDGIFVRESHHRRPARQHRVFVSPSGSLRSARKKMVREFGVTRVRALTVLENVPGFDPRSKRRSRSVGR